MFSSRIQIFLKFLFHLIPCTEKKALHGWQCEVEDCADFLVGHVFVTAEDDGHALLFGKGLNAGVDGIHQFIVECGIVGLGGAFLGVRLVEVLFPLLDGDFAAARALSAFVEDEVPCDGKHPRRELGCWFVSMGGFPYAHEHLLGDVFSVVGGAHHFYDGSDDSVLVSCDELLESCGVARLDFQHELHVDTVCITLI